MENTEIQNEENDMIESQVADAGDNGEVISDDEIQNLDKLYYTIGEVSKMFNENSSLFRYWEKEFPSIKPKKNKKGNRLYTKKNIEEIKKIHFLVKDRGMTLDGAKKHLKTHSNDNGVANFEVIKLLQKIRSTVVELKDALEVNKNYE